MGHSVYYINAEQAADNSISYAYLVVKLPFWTIFLNMHFSSKTKHLVLRLIPNITNNSVQTKDVKIPKVIHTYKVQMQNVS